jgi:hypothetical protein
MITGSGVWVCVFPKCCNCMKFWCLNENGWFYRNIFEFVEVIGLPGDSSLLLLPVQLEGFCLSLGWIAVPTCVHHLSSLWFLWV